MKHTRLILWEGRLDMHSAPERHLEMETQRDRILDDLYSFLRIPSVSTDPAHRSDIREAARWVEARLRRAGPLTIEIIETDGHPVVYAEWLGAPDRPTILVYGHYDVQPPDPLEQWLSPPFAPEMRAGRVYARGASDDKGPMFIPIAVAEAFFATDGALPVNVKLLFEGEEEIGSPHLDGFVTAHAARLAATYALSADGAMWRASEPSISIGSRGLVALDIEVRGPICIRGATAARSRTPSMRWPRWSPRCTRAMGASRSRASTTRYVNCGPRSDGRSRSLGSTTRRTARRSGRPPFLEKWVTRR